MQQLHAAEVTAAIDPSQLGFRDTSELLGERYGWIGQERAEKAARFGLALDQPGYHLFVLGGVGSGRSSLLRGLMQEVATGQPSAPDLVYLYNFEQPQRPLALRLLSGRGSLLRSALEGFAAGIAHDIPRRLEEEDVQLDSERIRKGGRQLIDHAYAELARFAGERRFALRRDEGRLVFTLLDDDGQVMQEDTILGLTTDERVRLEETERELRAEIGRYLETVRPIELRMERELNELRRAAVAPLVEERLAAIRRQLSGQTLDDAKLERYFGHLAEDVLGALEVFSPSHEDGAASAVEALLARYRVNIVVEHAEAAGAPVLHDDDPVFRSLFGGIDYQAENGVLVTDFMRIRAGNLIRAHGGYLMLYLRDVMRDGSVWEKLQRYLRNGTVQIEEPSAELGSLATTTLEPEALEVKIKLVLIGGRDDYYQLQEADPEFSRLFRVKVDFAEHFPATPATRHAVAVFVAQQCDKRGLLHFSAEAVARLLLDMQRDIDDQRRMSACFGKLDALIIESSAQAQAGGATQVGAGHVAAALAARRERHDYPEQAQLEALADGDLMIRVEGAVVGQLNGLSQIDLGDYRFGSPVRISARAYAGDEGVLNIDREVEMTGPHHDKGMLILQGWLSAAFEAIAPLSLSASLVFEQEYHGVEGDSASCAELYALLSALSGLPLAQGLAVTGALNQHGEVMPIGGVNEKIEGWFRTCQRLGFSGAQGVIIPTRNRAHLMLDEEVQAAVREGRFRIYAIDQVEEGIALLTGIAAGARDASGHYPDNTVLGRAQAALERFRKACDDSGGHAREHEHGHGR